MAEQQALGPLTSWGPSFPTPDTPEGGDYAIRDAKGQIVAETFARSDYTVTQPAKAYAQLFAAAPDLLALARLIEHETGEDENGELPHEPREALLVLRDAARAAIAKATGDSHD